jgi:hypothetical protein
MDDTNLQLVGIAVVLAGGFVMVAEAAGSGWPDGSLGFWAVLLGLGVSVAAPWVVATQQ